MNLLYRNRRLLDRTDRILLYASYTLRGILFAQIVLAFMQSYWLTVFLSSGILLLTLVPVLLRQNHRLYLPLEFDFAAVLFVFAALFLGEIRSYYVRFWWWDVVLHTSSGLLMGLVGFTLVYVLNREQPRKLATSPLFVSLFSFAFAMMIGVLWEIFEFGMDSLFGADMQKSGLVDTMWDLIVNTAGALVISIAGYFYVKGRDSLLFDRVVRRFIERNGDVFGRRPDELFAPVQGADAPDPR